jgi:hypothetical protein
VHGNHTTTWRRVPNSKHVVRAVQAVPNSEWNRMPPSPSPSCRVVLRHEHYASTTA